MKTVRYELKYCERCGTLKLRPISFANNYCLLCERMLARFRFPRDAGAAGVVGLHSAGEVKMLAGIVLSMNGIVASGRGAMSTSSVAAGRLPFAVIAGGRARQDQDEIDCRRADAMFFRAQTLAICPAFLRYRMPDRPAAVDFGTRILSRSSPPLCNTELRGAGGICAQCGTSAGTTE